MYIEPPHKAWDKEKLSSMVKTLKKGRKLPAVLVHGGQAYSGSHRLAAWEAMGMDADYVEISDDDYEKIMTSMNLDPIYDSVYDFEPFLEEALYLGVVDNVS